MKEIDKKYIVLFNVYRERIREEKLSGMGSCSLSVKLSDMLFGFVKDIDVNKEIKDKDVAVLGLVSKSDDKIAEYHRLAYCVGKNTKAAIHCYPEYTCTVADEKVVIPPLLDDMAQIIGPDARYSEDNLNSIAKVLKKRNACMIVGNGVLAMGRSLDEAYVSCLVLEKSAKCLIDVTVIGKYNKINAIETRLMHFVYQKKYSKQNQNLVSNENKASSDSANTAKTEYSNKERELREAVKAAGIRLLKSNLVQGTWGNISIRLDDKHMLITPTGLDYLSLKPEDMVLVNIETMEYKGLHKPSGEKDIHAMLLRSRKDINVVMHSHPAQCSALAAARVDLPLMSEEMNKYVKGDAKVSKYALPSTMKLAKASVASIEGRNACLMANHGMLSVGATVDETFETCRVMEQSANAYIDKLASDLSSAETPNEKRKDIFRRKYKNSK